MSQAPFEEFGFRFRTSSHINKTNQLNENQAGLFSLLIESIAPFFDQV